MVKTLSCVDDVEKGRIEATNIELRDITKKV